MSSTFERPKLWQFALALFFGFLFTVLTARHDNEASRLIAEGSRVEARILSAKQGSRRGTNTTCHVEFSFQLPDGSTRLVRDSAPSSECRAWERLLARGKTPLADAIVSRDGTALLWVEAQQRSRSLATIPPLVRFFVIAGAVLLLSIMIRAYLPPRT